MNLIINLIILVCVGFLRGAEREQSHKVIGVRSTILVLLGAFIFTFISTKVGGDPARIIAQVVCGSGFIGAGIIFKNDASSIFNLTTAIFVWVLSGLGCMIALGLYPESILISIIVFIILKIKKNEKC